MFLERSRFCAFSSKTHFLFPAPRYTDTPKRKLAGRHSPYDTNHCNSATKPWFYSLLPIENYWALVIALRYEHRNTKRLLQKNTGAPLLVWMMRRTLSSKTLKSQLQKIATTVLSTEVIPWLRQSSCIPEWRTCFLRLTKRIHRDTYSHLVTRAVARRTFAQNFLWM